MDIPWMSYTTTMNRNQLFELQLYEMQGLSDIIDTGN